MMKYKLSLMTLLTTVLMLAFGSNVFAVGTLTLTPATGAPGIAITVTGTGFVASSSGTVWFDTNNNSIYDSGEPAGWGTTTAGGVLAVSNTLTVPDLAAGPFQVRALITGDGGVASAAFTVTVGITLSPTLGPTGQLVTVTGSGFPFTTALRVYFDQNIVPNDAFDAGETYVDITSSATGTISTTLTVPVLANGVYPICIDAPSYTAPSIALANYTVQTPGVTLSATAGNPGFPTLTVAGTGFSGTTSFRVLFDTNANGAYDSGENTFTGTTNALGAFPATGLAVPIAPAGAYNVLVDCPIGGAVEVSSAFTISAITLVVAPTSGTPGSIMTVTGANYNSGASGVVWLDTNGNSVYDFGEPSASTTVSAAGAIPGGVTLTVPAGLALGAYSVRADIPLGAPLEKSATFTVPVTSLTLAPTSGGPSTVVAVTGAGFQASTLSRIWLDLNGNGVFDVLTETTVMATPTSSASGAIASTPITLPASITPGTYNFLIDCPVDGTVEATKAFVVPIPGITATPATGGVGTAVTIAGAGFTITTAGDLWLDTNKNGAYTTSVALEVASHSVPVTSASGALVATVIIIPALAPGSYNFFYDCPIGGAKEGVIPFVVTGTGITLTPASGAAGTLVTVTGTGFAAGAGPGNIWFDTNNNSLLDPDETSIPVNASTIGTLPSGLHIPVPAGLAAGDYNIRVNLPDGGAIEASAVFSVTAPVTPPPTSSVTVLYPNGGETFVVGSPINISWTAANVANVKIEASTDGGVTWAMVAATVPATPCTYILTPTVAGANMLIKVTDAAGTASDRSDQVFNVNVAPVTPPATASVTVLSPNGGETFAVGAPVNITWISAGVANVKIESSVDGGVTWATVVATVPATPAAYAWTPAAAAANMLIKVTDAAGTATDRSDQAFDVNIAPVTPPATASVTVLSPNGGEVIAAGAAVNILFTAANVDSVDVFVSADASFPAASKVGRVAASAGKLVWTAAFGQNLLVKVAAKDGSASDVSNAVFTVQAGAVTPPTPAVAKAVLNDVPSTMAQINNVNVTKVAFTGTATAGDSISVKLVDVAGLASTVTTVVANAVGKFTGTVNASPLANGLVTLMAGKVVGGAVASWIVFADYLKDAVTIGAPAALTITDVPGDNGGFVYVNFTVSAQHPGMTGATLYNTVASYQLFKRGTVAPDTLWTSWALIWPADPAQLLPTNKQQSIVATVKNGTMQWKLVATTMAGNSVATGIASGGSAKVAELLNGVDKAAEGIFSDVSNVATGGSVDDIAPTALTVFSADNTPGSGITVSWTPNADHGIVAGYTFNGLTLPIWGVDKYEIYRAVKGTTNFTLVGFGGPGSTSYLDATAAPGTTVYDYYIKLVDGNTDHLVKTTDMLAMSAKGGASGTDFNSDGTIGLADLVLLGQAWNTKKANLTTWISLFDLNSDGVVDLGDLVVLGSNWGKTTAKMIASAPTVSNPFELKAEVNENSSMYFVNINVKDAATYNGVAFTLNYDTKAFEFVKESVNGLVGITLANESKPGVIDVASYFQNEKFNGTITLGFKSKGLNSDMNLRMANAEIAINNEVSAVSGAPSVTLKALPTVYGLSQNFPNPFNPSTTITYSMPKTSHVELAIYNMAGQKIRTLVNTSQAASFYRVVWNGRNDFGQTVASGLYFYRLNAGNYSKVVKMNLIK